jgi:hypothetical protein
MSCILQMQCGWRSAIAYRTVSDGNIAHTVDEAGDGIPYGGMTRNLQT